MPYWRSGLGLRSIDFWGKTTKWVEGSNPEDTFNSVFKRGNLKDECQAKHAFKMSDPTHSTVFWSLTRIWFPLKNVYAGIRQKHVYTL